MIGVLISDYTCNMYTVLPRYIAINGISRFKCYIAINDLSRLMMPSIAIKVYGRKRKSIRKYRAWHGLFLNRTSSNHITCKFTVYSLYCHLERIWLYVTEI